MKAERDVSGAMYVNLQPDGQEDAVKVARTVDLGNGVMVDLAEDGRPLGVEILLTGREYSEPSVEQWDWTSTQPCSQGPHRGPEGPNEDLSQCPQCWSLSHTMRPEGETYGKHLPDCSLPERHESHCRPGGSGHPPAPVIRGYWP